MPSMTAWTEAMLAPFATAFGGAAKKRPEPEGAAAEPMDETSDLRQVVRELQKQVEAMRGTRAKKRGR